MPLGTTTGSGGGGGLGTTRSGGGGTYKGVSRTQSKKKPDVRSGVGGLFENIWDEFEGIVTGIPEGVVQTFTHPLRTLEGMGKFYWDMYGGLFTGDPMKTLRAFYRHPVSLGLDALMLASLGTTAGVRVGLLAAAPRQVALHTPATMATRSVRGRVVERAFTSGAPVVKEITGSELRRRSQIARHDLLNRLDPNLKVLGEYERAARVLRRQGNVFDAKMRLKLSPVTKAYSHMGRREALASTLYLMMPSTHLMDQYVLSHGDKIPSEMRAIMESPEIREMVANPTPRMRQARAAWEPLSKEIWYLMAKNGVVPNNPLLRELGEFRHALVAVGATPRTFATTRSWLIGDNRKKGNLDIRDELLRAHIEAFEQASQTGKVKPPKPVPVEPPVPVSLLPVGGGPLHVVGEVASSEASPLPVGPAARRNVFDDEPEAPVVRPSETKTPVVPSAEVLARDDLVTAEERILAEVNRVPGGTMDPDEITHRLLDADEIVWGKPKNPGERSENYSAWLPEVERVLEKHSATLRAAREAVEGKLEGAFRKKTGKYPPRWFEKVFEWDPKEGFFTRLEFDEDKPFPNNSVVIKDLRKLDDPGINGALDDYVDIKRADYGKGEDGRDEWVADKSEAWDNVEGAFTQHVDAVGEEFTEFVDAEVAAARADAPEAPTATEAKPPPPGPPPLAPRGVRPAPPPPRMVMGAVTPAPTPPKAIPLPDIQEALSVSRAAAPKGFAIREARALLKANTVAREKIRRVTEDQGDELFREIYGDLIDKQSRFVTALGNVRSKATRQMNLQLAEQLEKLVRPIDLVGIGYKGGRMTLDEIKASLDAIGAPHPLWVPDVTSLEGPGGPGQLTLKGSMKTPSKPPPFARLSTGQLWRTGMVMLHPEILTRSWLAASRFEVQDEFHARVLKFARRVDAKHPLGTDEVWVRQRPSERFSHVQSNALKVREQLESMLGEDVPPLTGTLASDLLEETLPDGRKVRYVIPKNAAKVFERDYRNTSNAMKWFVTKPLEVWRSLVLNWSPRWLVNNTVGLSLLYALRANGLDGMKAYLRAVGETRTVKKLLNRPETRKYLTQSDIEELFADQFRGVFMETQLPLFSDVAQLGKVRVGGAVNRVRNLGRPSPLVRLDIGYERMVRHAMVLQEVKRHPGLKKFLKESVGDVQSLRDKTREYFARNPGEAERISQIVNDALGDYFSLSQFERTTLRRIMPFWAWYRTITSVMAKAPLDIPLRARIVTLMGQVGAEIENDEGIPSYLKGALFVGGDMIFRTSGVNLFATAPQLANSARLLIPGAGGSAFQGLGVYNPFAVALIKTAGEALKGETPRLGIPGNVLKEMLVSTPEAQIISPRPSQVYSDDDRVAALKAWLGVPWRELDRRGAAEVARRYG